MNRRTAAGGALGLAALLTLTGCHHRATTASGPPPPAYNGGGGTHGSRHGATGKGSAVPGTGTAPGSSAAGFFDDTRLPPVTTETGLATWYYARARAGSDGALYGLTAPTAAHKTLPLGSTVRVTNLQNGQSTFVRITDRGPFVPGRILDMSEYAAKQIGLYRPGVAQVRLEAFPHPGADPLGRWCVQTGPFGLEGDALDLKSTLSERYRGARVSEFRGSTGFWVRIDPESRSKPDAVGIASWIGAPDAQTNSYLVRVN